MLCLAKLRRDVHKFVWRNGSPNMLWYSSMKMFLMFHCWSWLGCFIKSLKDWIDMNGKLKSDEISLAATLDQSNFSTRKLVPRKYFVACIWCIASRGFVWGDNNTLRTIDTYMQQASCCKMYMPLFPVPQPNKTKACWKLLIRCITALACWSAALADALLCAFLAALSVQISSWEVTMWYFIWPYRWWWTVTKSWPNEPTCN